MTHDPDSWWLDECAHAGREHFDEQHARRYDAKMDAEAEQEVRLLLDAGILERRSSVVDIGAGTGQFTLAAASACATVVAVDVSPVMLALLRENVDRRAVSNVETVRAGFLTYEHAGPPADLVYSRFALHHLPDFWKAIAWFGSPRCSAGRGAAPVGRRLRLCARGGRGRIEAGSRRHER